MSEAHTTGQESGRLGANIRTSRDYLAHAVQSLGKAWTAWKVAEALQGAHDTPKKDPLAEAYFYTMDALLQGVAGFVGALDEATAAKQLIEYPHTHKLFEPTLIRRELLLAGQFLTAFEILMGSTVGQLRASFYTDETPPAERAEKEQEYADQVLALDKSVLRASCLWLQQQGVLTDEDIVAIDGIRRRRNDVAHRLPTLLFTKTWYVPVDQFPVVAALVAKIDMWWLQRSGAKQPRSWPMVLLEYMLESVAQVEMGENSPLRPFGERGSEGTEVPQTDSGIQKEIGSQRHPDSATCRR